MKIAVVMPAYNAAETIEGVFRRVPEEALDIIDRFIVVNDGSTDKTKDIVKKLKEGFKVAYVEHVWNRGYGGAQKTGFRAALSMGADVIVLLHSDGQYAPERIMDMMRPVLDGEADIVGGSRLLGGGVIVIMIRKKMPILCYINNNMIPEGKEKRIVSLMKNCGMPLVRYVGNIILTKIENRIFGANLTSYHSGYKVYSRKALGEIPFEGYSDKFHFDSEMLVGAIRKKLRVKEIPIPIYYGKERSYLEPIRYGIGVLGVIWKYLRGEI